MVTTACVVNTVEVEQARVLASLQKEFYKYRFHTYHKNLFILNKFTR